MAFGDFTVTRASTKNVFGSAGLYVSVANDVPAFEFNADGTYRGLPIEPGATNLALRSQEFDVAGWVKTSAGTGNLPVVTANDAVAPDGTTTADLIVFDRGAGNTVTDRSVIAQTPTVVNATAYTASFFLKAATAGDVGKQIAIRGVAGTGYGVITLTADWVRYTRTETSTSTAGNIELANRGTYSTDNVVSVHAWQAQLELGAVDTSYIPTVASTVTRAADVVSLTGASSLIGQTEGTLYVEVEWRKISGTTQFLFAVSNNTTSNRVAIYRNNASNELRMIFNANSTTQTNQGITDAAITGVIKTAFGYAEDDGVLYLNGSVVSTDSSIDFSGLATLTQIDIGQRAGGADKANMWIRSVALFPTRLTNDQLASLTTL